MVRDFLRLKDWVMFFVIGLLLSSTLVFAAKPSFDPFFWMEEVESEPSLTWVKEQNLKTTDRLESHPEFHKIQEDIKEIYHAKDDVAFAYMNNGYFWNFWQDEKNEHGVIRRCTLEEYKKENPQWEIILDIDELSKKENENWVFAGSVKFDKKSSKRLLKLSRGGKDAVVIREFDYTTKEFIEDGFNIPEAKTDVTPLDENHVLIGSDFGEGSLTKSNYPRIIKLWTRGEPLSAAKTVFEVKTSDLSARAFQVRDNETKYTIFVRYIDFFSSEYFLQKEDGALKKLEFPVSAAFLGIKNNFLYVQIKSDSGSENIPSNSIIRYSLSEGNLNNPEVIFKVGEKQSIEDVTLRKNGMIINILDNIKSRILEVTSDDAGVWTQKVLPLPETGIISYEPSETDSDFTLMTYTDHLTPSSQYLVHDKDGSYKLELLKSAPHRFDSSSFEVVQNFSKSKDGTLIPYFLIKKKNMVLDGTAPTILYGYGGFEISLTPSYSGVIGKAWLERGGVYVVANIRGGGEFGPAWHQAALKENRHKAYEDFISVAEDLIQKDITSPRHLGIEGGSNGGLLVGATMVQRPDLFNAALIQVPLLDMFRYSKLLAGASWIAEYGDPDIESECEKLLSYSPYHNVRAGVRYPVPMFTTSTKDDRVHPAHARKMAARMAEQGHGFYYYENINGGHAGSANGSESIRMHSLEYTYFWNRLR